MLCRRLIRRGVSSQPRDELGSGQNRCRRKDSVMVPKLLSRTDILRVCEDIFTLPSAAVMTIGLTEVSVLQSVPEYGVSQ